MDFKKVFGEIKAPDELKPFTAGDPTGTVGISKFFSNFIALIYSAAAIVFVLMIVWGAWDWITSEGEKEKIQQAKQKIIHAMVGILLFAVAFAIISVFGEFTGFSFFSTSRAPLCPAGETYYSSDGKCRPVFIP